jgi:hypothetical protein
MSDTVYKIGDHIKIDGIKYKINFIFTNYYKIERLYKQGLLNKETLKIDVKPIYNAIWEFNEFYEVLLHNNNGAIDRDTCKVLLEPVYSYDDNLVKIHEELLKSKMRIEKLKQLEEMI